MGVGSSKFFNDSDRIARKVARVAVIKEYLASKKEGFQSSEMMLMGEENDPLIQLKKLFNLLSDVSLGKKINVPYESRSISPDFDELLKIYKSLSLEYKDNDQVRDFSEIRKNEILQMSAFGDNSLFQIIAQA